MMAKLGYAGLFALVSAAIALACPGSSFAAEYKLGAQDKLRIKVYEWPALSDEVTVGDDGMISLPLIGSVNAAGVSPTEFARTIAQRLQAHEKLAGTPYASVEVLQYRPFYILGDVQRPGEYQYRPGMTVLMAVSISGGVYRPTDSLRLERDAILSKGSLSTLEAKRWDLAARLARLKSELNGNSKIEVDLKPLTEVGRSPELPLEQESSIMAAKKKSFLNQIAGLRLQIAGYRDEINLLSARMESSIRQQRSVEKEAQAFKVLEDKGLGVLPRQAALERLAAQIEGDQREIDTLSSRARQNIGQAEAAISKLIDERDKDLAMEIRQTSAELDEVEKEIAMQRSLLNEAEALSGTILRANRSEMSLRFRISRRDPEGVVREFVAQKDDPVDPGDVITVERDLAGREFGRGSGSDVPAAGARARAEIEFRSGR
jgi:protein involved in polysaccharide export with SLBB domain